MITTDALIRTLIRWLGAVQWWLASRVQDPAWRTSEGRVVFLSAMADSHLLNAWAMSARLLDVRRTSELHAEIRRRGLKIDAETYDRAINRPRWMRKGSQKREARLHERWSLGPRNFADDVRGIGADSGRVKAVASGEGRRIGESRRDYFDRRGAQGYGKR